MTTDTTAEKKTSNVVDELFAVGAHYGYKKTRRHPSTAKYVFGVKNAVEIIDLEKTLEKLEEAEEFVKQLAQKKKQLLFVSSKPEIKKKLVSCATSSGAPYVAGRWIGGTLTNFEQVSKRIERLETLREQREKGELSQYTKHEQLLIDREIERLDERFGGLVSMKKIPGALFVIDPNMESIAVKEAHKVGIPVIALAGTDCDIRDIAYPILANDSNVKSINYITKRIAGAYTSGQAASSDKTHVGNTVSTKATKNNDSDN